MVAREGGEAIKANKIATSVGSVPRISLTQRLRDTEAQRNSGLSPHVFFVQILHINHSCACALTGRVAILAAREGGRFLRYSIVDFDIILTVRTGTLLAS